MTFVAAVYLSENFTEAELNQMEEDVGENLMDVLKSQQTEDDLLDLLADLGYGEDEDE